MAKFYVLQVVRIMRNQRHVIKVIIQIINQTSNYYQIFESA
jgi:hypothetical protein